MPPAAPAFAEAARRMVEELPAGDLTRRLLVVLLAHGLGRRSALRREDLLAHLATAPGSTVGDASHDAAARLPPEPQAGVRRPVL